MAYPLLPRFRRMVVGCDIIYVGVRTTTISRGQRLRNIDDDYGLQVHGARSCVVRLSESDFTYVGATTGKAGNAAADRRGRLVAVGWTGICA